MHRYLVVVEQAGTNYSAYSPDVPGCIATGPTPEDVRARMQEAIEFHLQGLIEDGLPLPEPSSSAAMIEVRL